jgi:uncharacterized protein YbcI
MLSIGQAVAQPPAGAVHRPTESPKGGRVADVTANERGSLTAAISNVVVMATADYTGRGPTRARTTIDGDWIFVALHDTLTKGERKLADTGRGDVVRGMRREFQDAMREELVAAINELTGRDVVAMLSDNHMDPDIAIEAFYLRPVDA